MELTQDEAYSLLHNLADRLSEARAMVHDLEGQRARIVAHFDGQEGMARARMAQTLGVSLPLIQRMVNAHRPTEEAEVQPVTMPDDLRRDLQAALAIADDLLPALEAEEKAKKQRQHA